MLDTEDDSPTSPLIALYLEKRDDLKRFFAARLGSVEAAEDLVQDVYLKLARGPPAEPVDNPLAYLYRLGSNLMLDRIKQQRRAIGRDDHWYQAHRAVVGGVDAAPEPPADDAAAAREKLRRIVEALQEVEPRMGEAFRLHKLEGMSHPEVAAAMKVSRSAVEKWISAVLRHLRARVG